MRVTDRATLNRISVDVVRVVGGDYRRCLGLCFFLKQCTCQVHIADRVILVPRHRLVLDAGHELDEVYVLSRGRTIDRKQLLVRFCRESLVIPEKEWRERYESFIGHASSSTRIASTSSVREMASE